MILDRSLQVGFCCYEHLATWALKMAEIQRRETQMSIHFAKQKLPVPSLTIPQLLEEQAKHIPDSPAIFALDRDPLTYGRLYQHIRDVGRSLRAMQIGRRDRVALALPNGPELATAILAVEAHAVCALVNPGFSVKDLTRILTLLKPSALITPSGIDSAARRAGLSLGIPMIELSKSDAVAGLFGLAGAGDQECPAPDEPAVSDDLALVMGTSGTTADPKIVRLTHGNICTSACWHSAALELQQNDHCLNIMPLHYCHGLNATLMPTLHAGASIVCTPGLDPSRFFDWLAEYRPTWYSSVPTMHAAIVAAAQNRREREHSLRFVRSSSASLAPRIFAELEETFHVPVIEFYGMAEVASAPIACNPFPPRPRKPGSVGLPIGLDVAVMDDDGEAPLPDGEIGHLFVRGPTVMTGYDDPAATQAAFRQGWFKTEDCAFFDKDGYLFLVGRRMELIVRGGERIPPREIEEVLLDHPAVAEAAAFPIPHPTLGDIAGAAVILRTPTSRDHIRQFISERVTYHKVPQIYIVHDLPKGPTGKVLRRELAASLGFVQQGAVTSSFVAPRTPLEKGLAECIADILQIERVGIHDNFFALGGDSLQIVKLMTLVHDRLDLELDVSAFLAEPTIAQVTKHLSLAS
jgi:acyl-CoA synthetase (AMP-forming)/AMP-acid ligase II/acyl carrier protein